jgi:hypothetical protein
MIFRTEDLKKIGGYDQRWVFAADYDACLKLIKNSSARSINEILSDKDRNMIKDIKNGWELSTSELKVKYIRDKKIGDILD